MHNVTISNWERGVKTPALEMVPVLARALGVTAEHLERETEELRIDLAQVARYDAAIRRSSRLAGLGSRLQEARMSAGMTVEDAAVELDVSPAALSRWERGATRPDAHVFFDAAKVYNVSAEWLWDGTGTKERVGMEEDVELPREAFLLREQLLLDLARLGMGEREVAMMRNLLTASAMRRAIAASDKTPAELEEFFTGAMRRLATVPSTVAALRASRAENEASPATAVEDAADGDLPTAVPHTQREEDAERAEQTHSPARRRKKG